MTPNESMTGWVCLFAVVLVLLAMYILKCWANADLAKDVAKLEEENTRVSMHNLELAVWLRESREREARRDDHGRFVSTKKR